MRFAGSGSLARSFGWPPELPRFAFGGSASRELGGSPRDICMKNPERGAAIFAAFPRRHAGSPPCPSFRDNYTGDEGTAAPSSPYLTGRLAASASCDPYGSEGVPAWISSTQCSGSPRRSPMRAPRNPPLSSVGIATQAWSPPSRGKTAGLTPQSAPLRAIRLRAPPNCHKISNFPTGANRLRRRGLRAQRDGLTAKGSGMPVLSARRSTARRRLSNSLCA